MLGRPSPIFSWGAGPSEERAADGPTPIFRLAMWVGIGGSPK